MRRAVFLTADHPDHMAGGAERRTNLIGSVMRDHGWQIRFASTVIRGHPDEFLLPGNRYALRHLWPEARILGELKGDLFHMHGLCPRAASLRMARPALLAANPGARFVLGTANLRDQLPNRNRLRLAEMEMPAIMRPAAWCVAALRDRAARWGVGAFDRLWITCAEQEAAYAGGHWPPQSRMDGMVEMPNQAPALPARFAALFLGSIRHVKGIDRMLDLAAQPSLRGMRIVVAGPMLERQYEARVLEAHRRGEIEYVGTLDREGVDKALTEASILINTSRNEGACNAYLEAWAYARPVLAWEAEFDGHLSKGGRGWLRPGLKEMELALLHLSTHPAEVQEAGRNGRAWAEKSTARSRVETQLRAALESLELPLDA